MSGENGDEGWCDRGEGVMLDGREGKRVGEGERVGGWGKEGMRSVWVRNVVKGAVHVIR